MYYLVEIEIGALKYIKKLFCRGKMQMLNEMLKTRVRATPDIYLNIICKTRL